MNSQYNLLYKHCRRTSRVVEPPGRRYNGDGDPLAQRFIALPLSRRRKASTPHASWQSSQPEPAASNPVEASGPFAVAVAARDSVVDQFAKLDGLWDRFIPMSVLFFLMAFVNTIIDSLKDSLVITAVGGGTEVLPYLSVYGVLPSSVLFLIVYSWGTQRFSRERLFNVIIASFLAFYSAFAFVYPNHEALHLSGWADGFAAVIPAGLSGLVGMVRNWLFTLFYCFSELWGDVVLSLLFWGLANETTSIEDAPLLYPLFGIGANLAQTLAGRSLRVFSDAAGVSMSYAAQLQATIGLCVVMGCIIVVLHAHIARTFPKNPKGSTLAKMALERRVEAAATLAQSNRGRADHMAQVKLDLEASVRGLNYCDIEEHAHHRDQSLTDNAAPAAKNGSFRNNGASGHQRRLNGLANGNGNGNGASNGVYNVRNRLNGQAIGANPPSPPKRKAAASVKRSMSLRDAWEFLAKSPQIQCLAVMAVAQGITTRLLEVSWKHYLHKLHTTPAAYAAFLGDTAMWTGIVTGTLMFTSPMLFDRIGWKGVASVTPKFMLWGGVPFFVGCIAYNFLAGPAVGAGLVTLQVLVVTGAIMQVFSRGAKFSLFKPAEEMVYIGLDDESRSKGKAAIDVVGAQSGKSVGSILQQALLILTGGTVGGILPALAIFYAVMLRKWNSAVADLAEHYDPAHVHRLSVMGSLDEGDGDESLTGEVLTTPLGLGEPSPA